MNTFQEQVALLIARVQGMLFVYLAVAIMAFTITLRDAPEDTTTAFRVALYWPVLMAGRAFKDRAE